VTQRQRMGRVRGVSGPVIRAAFSGLPLGAMCAIPRAGQHPLVAEVIGTDGNDVRLSPFGETEHLTAGGTVLAKSGRLEIPLSDSCLGRIINAFGDPLDDQGCPIAHTRPVPIRASAPLAAERPVIAEPLPTGVAAIDTLLTVGRGQRIAVFGPPGTGKSSLLAALACHADVDVIVIGLVGERGREVNEFATRDLSPAIRTRVVIVAATSDCHPSERALCAQSATATAEYFRDQGKSVLLLIDSLTRTARALREIGLAAGEPPARHGYPASVYPALPRLIERAGRTAKGDITAFYTVLTEGDDQVDPITEEVKSLTDGHIVLSRALAERGHFPALDVLESLSRSMASIVPPPHLEVARTARRHLAKYRDIELLLQVGEYQSGSDPDADAAVRTKAKIDAVLQQDTNATAQMPTALRQLHDAVQ